MVREIAREHLDKLAGIKLQIEQSYKNFSDNYRRYQKFMRFVYDSSLSGDDIAKLNILKKPNIEFNILEAYINRRVGEFAQHEPELQIRAADGLTSSQITDDLIETIKVVEDHVRHIIDDTQNDGFEAQIYKDTMGGGFSVAEVYTDYISDMSFEQSIHVERVFDPTLCGFDPLARKSHKGDGEYCFKIVPLTKAEFESRYGKAATVGMSYARDFAVGSFNWSYMNQEEKIILVCYFFRKERKKERIVKLTNGAVILKRHYEQLAKHWNDELYRMEQLPIIIEERSSFIETIWLYEICETGVLDAKQTVFKYLPLVFIDGNSAVIRRSDESSSYQMTKPYVYQAEGAQRLKNFAGQSVASEIETMVQHKFLVAIESIPDDYIDAYTNPQQAQVLAYNAFYNKNVQQPLPAPQVIQRTDTPQIVQAIFEGTDRVTQAILGSFDAQQGIVGDKISGKAIEAGAMQSDAAAVPYLENYIKGLNRIGQILIDLIPKYYVTPRSIPIRKSNGMRDYKVINDKTNPESIDLNYSPNSLQIKIEAGVNSTMQKQYALRQIVALMEASELFAEFMNSDGLEILLENIDIRGIEELKKRAADFMGAKKQMQEQQAGQPDPIEQALETEQQRIQGELSVEVARIEQKREEAEGNLSIKSAQVAVDEQRAHVEFIKALSELEGKERARIASDEKEMAETAKDAIQMAIDISKHHHEINKAEKEHD